MVIEINKNKEIKATNPIDGFMNITAKSIVLAMGCRERPRGSIIIPGSRPAGILTAGTAQRYMNIEGYHIGNTAVILGSGDIGLIMARRLTLEGVKVLAVVEIMPYSNGLPRNIAQCLDDFNIPLLLSHTITDIDGKNRVQSITVQKVDETKTPIENSSIIFECDTLLLSIGLIPENELSKMANIDIDYNTKGPFVNEIMETSVSGIFACGNVLHVNDIVDNVYNEGKKAGKYSSLFIKRELSSNKQQILTKCLNGIKYILPQRVDKIDSTSSMQFYFRVSDVYENKYILIKNNNLVIKKIKKRIMVPSEMQSIKLSISELNHIISGFLSIEVSEV